MGETPARAPRNTNAPGTGPRAWSAPSAAMAWGAALSPARVVRFAEPSVTPAGQVRRPAVSGYGEPGYGVATRLSKSPADPPYAADGAARVRDAGNR